MLTGSVKKSFANFHLTHFFSCRPTAPAKKPEAKKPEAKKPASKPSKSKFPGKGRSLKDNAGKMALMVNSFLSSSHLISSFTTRCG